MVDSKRMAVPKPVAQRLAIAADDAATQAEYDENIDRSNIARLRMTANNLRAASRDSRKRGEFVSVRVEDVVRATEQSTETFKQYRTATIKASLSMLSNYDVV